MSDVSKLVLAICLPIVLITISFKVLDYIRDHPAPKFKAGDCVVWVYAKEFTSETFHARILKVGVQNYLKSPYSKYTHSYLDGDYTIESSIRTEDSLYSKEDCLK